MQDIINIAKALSDKKRLRALMMLTKGELCLCQIIEMLNLSPSTVSKHMTILKHAGLVEARKQGRWVYYRLPKSNVPVIVKNTIQLVRSSLNKDSRILQDASCLKNVMEKDLEQLCRHYRK
ncbi:MAG: ArsR/SmtB family transcription factor [Planctomycetota bacterium]|jgi:DNA-binding transcriptional ArsR family regulator